MTGGRSYGSPGAFRRALTDKLRNLAAASRWTLKQLQQQMAYDRLLERLNLVDEGWIIKGATALLARDIGVRGTIDIDLYREAAREIAFHEYTDWRDTPYRTATSLTDELSRTSSTARFRCSTSHSLSHFSSSP